MANQAPQNRNARNQLVQNQPIRSQTTPNRLRWWSWTDLRIRQHRILVERHYPMPEGGPAHAKGTIEVESRQTGRIIRVNWYCGMDNTNAAAPVIIHLSGRNFCVKSHGIDDEFLHIVARENSPFIVLDVEYRIAPEYPYPAALEDIQDVLQYLRHHPADYDLNHLAICGFGAGGNLALAMALSSPRDTFETAVVFYPVTDLSYPEKRKIQLMEPDIRRRMRRGTGGVMPPWVMESTIQSYLRGNHPNIVDDPRLSPIRQQDETLQTGNQTKSKNIGNLSVAPIVTLKYEANVTVHEANNLLLWLERYASAVPIPKLLACYTWIEQILQPCYAESSLYQDLEMRSNS
ncbi:hypothetical protein RIB2604_02603090 [Aspergillus luchuensis]|uniref:Alpha/beta hydrolase fold-3 domain-containing protein n=1 Tax=Aspergillus kawachii TaxID=1069201 RepID=A0A146FSX7_ASPKA|nr:hypothetical protein RIB2604_02603090 [Aspergillus luchuensis]